MRTGLIRSEVYDPQRCGRVAATCIPAASVFGSELADVAPAALCLSHSTFIHTRWPSAQAAEWRLRRREGVRTLFLMRVRGLRPHGTGNLL